eukprot:jgi/Chlat1/8901/Chrsp92S08233
MRLRVEAAHEAAASNSSSAAAGCGFLGLPVELQEAVALSLKDARDLVRVDDLNLSPHDWRRGAVNFLREASAAGNIPAAYLYGMGRFYHDGNPDGVEHIQVAASADYTPALFSLGVILAKAARETPADSRLKRDVALAAELWGRGAALGDVPCMVEYAYCLERGLGVQRQVQHAQLFYAQ